MKNGIIILLTLMLLFTGLSSCGRTSAQPLPKSMKGYELYSWQVEGQWQYTLISGTNRNKTMSEIVIGESNNGPDGWVNLHALGVEEMNSILGRVPEGEFVSWRGGSIVESPELSIQLGLPPRDVIDEIKAFAKQHGLDFNVIQ